MEKEPQPAIVRFEFSNVTIEATPSNAVVYLHEGGDSMYDHVYIEKEDDPEKDSQYFYIFRNNIPDFDKTCEIMRSKGFTFVELNECSDFDREQYYKMFPIPEELETHELTPRQENFVNYFRYVIETGQLSPNDFSVEGDLYL